ncbi:extracellular solute-binding protein [Spelaeicoccus albus]|nr:ABC transporter substrate-binding protein [Spelaeicoccus albus]
MVFSALACVSLSLSACGGSSNASAKTEQSLKGKPDYSGTLTLLTKFGTPELSPYFKTVTKEYKKLHPKVKFELDQQNDESIKAKTKSLVSSNSLPDIYFTWTGDWQKQFIRGHRAIDLSKVIAPNTKWGKTFGKAALDSFKYHGKYYTMPLYTDGKFMGYNKTLFKRAGAKVPKTFDGLLTACDKLKQHDITPVSLGNKEGWPVLHYEGQLVGYTVPHNVLKKDYDPKTAKYSNSGYVKSLSVLKKFVNHCTKGASMNGVSYTNAIQETINGDAAMYYQEILEFDQSNAKGTQLRKDGFGYFQLPAPAGDQQRQGVLEGAPEGYMISSASKHPKLALDFLKFLTNRKNARLLSAPPYGQPSAVKGVVSTDIASKYVTQATKDINNATYLVPWLDTANTPDVANTWKSSLQKFVSGSISAKDVMEQVRKAAKEAE